MPRILPKNLSDYYMMEQNIDITTAADPDTKVIFPCPRSGSVHRLYVTLLSAHAGSDTDLTFEIGGNAIPNSTLTIPSASSAIGRTHVIEFPTGISQCDILEAEDGDLIAVGSCLEVVSDEVGTDGCTANILLVVRRG